MPVVVVEGVKGANALRVLSGVIVLEVFGRVARGFGRRAGEEGGGVDHENAGAGDTFWERDRGFEGREGRVVDEDAVAAAQGLLTIFATGEDNGWPPRTRVSKSASSPFAVSVPLVPPMAANVMKSFERAAAAVLLEDSS